MANALQDLVLRIGGDSTGGQQATRDLANALANTLAKALADTGTQADASGEKLSGFAKYLDELTPKTDSAHASFTSLHSTLSEMWDNPTAAVKQFAGVIGTELSEALGAAGAVAGGVVAALVAVGVAAFELAEHAAQVGGALQDLSLKTGMSIEGLSKLSYAAQVAGGSIDQIANAMFMFEKQMGNDAPKVAKGLDLIGLSLTDIKQMAPEDQFTAIAKALSETEDATIRNAAGNDIFGKSFKDLVPLIMKLNEGLELTKDLNPWTAEETKLAEEFEMHLSSIRVHFEAIETSLGRGVLPSVEKFVAALDELAQWTPGEWLKKLMLFSVTPNATAKLAAGTIADYAGAAVAMVAPGGIGGYGGLNLPTSPQEPYSDGGASDKEIAQIQAGKLKPATLPPGVVGSDPAHTQSLIDSYLAAQKRAAEEIAKATEALTAKTTQLWDDYYQAVAKGAGDVLGAQLAADAKWYDAQYAEIVKSKATETAKADALIALNTTYYARLEADRAADATKQDTANTALAAKTTGFWDDYAKAVATASGQTLDAQIANEAKWYDAQYADIQKSKADEATKADALIALNTDYYGRLQALRAKDAAQQDVVNTALAAKTAGFYDDATKAAAKASGQTLAMEIANEAKWYDVQYADIVKSKADEVTKNEAFIALNTDYYNRLEALDQAYADKHTQLLLDLAAKDLQVQEQLHGKTLASALAANAAELLAYEAKLQTEHNLDQNAVVAAEKLYADKAQVIAKSFTLANFDFFNSLATSLVSLAPAGSAIANIAKEFNGIATSAAAAAKAVLQFGGNSAQAATSVVSLFVSWTQFLIAQGQAEDAAEAAKLKAWQDAVQGWSTTLSSPNRFRVDPVYLTDIDHLAASLNALDTQLRLNDDNTATWAHDFVAHMQAAQNASASGGTLMSQVDLATQTNEQIAQLAAYYQNVLAEALHVNDTLDAMGGLAHASAVDIADAKEQAGFLFAGIALGGKIGNDSLTALNTLVASFGQQAVDSGGLVDQFFLDMAAQAKAAGVQLDAVTAFFDTMNTKLAGGLKVAVAKLPSADEEGKTLFDGFDQAEQDALTKAYAAKQKADDTYKDSFDTFVLQEAQQATVHAQTNAQIAANDAQYADLKKQLLVAFGKTERDILTQQIADNRTAHDALVNDAASTTDSLTAVTDAAQAKLAANEKEAADLTKRLTGDMSDANRQRLTDRLAELDTEHTALQKEVAVDLTATQVQWQASFDRLSRIALASFNDLIAQGKSPVDAITAIGDSIDTLRDRQSSLGLASNAAFDSLNRWRTLITTNQDLVDSVGGLNDIMVALANTGGLDAATFKDLGDEGVASFAQLTAAGFTQQEAEQQLVPLLQNIIKLHQEKGYAIDEATQKLIDQATADGTLSAAQETDAEKQLDATNRVTDAVNHLANVLRGLPDAATDAATGISGELAKIKTPTITIPIRTDLAGDGASGIPGAWMGGIVTRFGVAQHLTAGGLVSTWPWIPQGTDTVPAMLTPGERVLSVAQNAALTAITSPGSPGTPFSTTASVVSGITSTAPGSPFSTTPSSVAATITSDASDLRAVTAAITALTSVVTMWVTTAKAATPASNGPLPSLRPGLGWPEYDPTAPPPVVNPLPTPDPSTGGGWIGPGPWTPPTIWTDAAGPAAASGAQLQQRLSALINQPSPSGVPLSGVTVPLPAGTTTEAAPTSVTKQYNVNITARNDDAAEKWRDWMRSDGVDIAVEELEDGRYVSRVNRALDR